MGGFAENWKKPGFFSPQKLEDGSWVFNDPQLTGPSNTVPRVVALRDMGEFVKALVIDQEPGTRVYGVSKFKTRNEVAEIWQKIHGVPTTTCCVSREEFAEAWPEVISREMTNNFAFAKESEYSGNGPGVKLPWDLGIKTTRLEGYIRSADWSLLKSTES